MADLQMSTAAPGTPGFMVLQEEDRRRICKAIGSDDPACTAKAGKPDGKKGYLENLGLSPKNIRELYRSAIRLVKEYPAQFKQLKEIYIQTYKKQPVFDPNSPDKPQDTAGTAESTATAKDQ